MKDILSSLPVKNPVLFLPLFLGSLRDYSGNGLHPTIQSSPHWSHLGNTNHLDCRNGYLIVNSSSLLNIDTFTFFVAANFIQQGSGTGQDWYIRKLLDDYRFYVDNTYIRMYNGSATSNVATDLTDAKTIGVSLASGNKPEFYQDGISLGQGNNTLTISTTEGSVLIGGSPSNTNALKLVLIYDEVLTDVQMSNLHEWSEECLSPTYKKKQFYVPSPITGRESDCVASYTFDNTGQSITDVSGSGYDVSLAPPATSTTDGILFDGGYAEVNPSPLIPRTNISVEVVIEPQNISGTTMMLCNGTSNGIAFALIQTSDTSLHWQVERTSDSSYRRVVLNIPERTRLHLVGTYSDITQDCYLYVNGYATQYSLTTASANPMGGSHLCFGARNSSHDLSWKGIIEYCRLYNVYLSQSDVSILYKQYSSAPYYVDIIDDSMESISSETAGPLSNTGYKILSGGYKISRDETNFTNGQKIIECTSDGVLYTESKQAYGTFQFDYYHSSDTRTRRICFIEDTLPEGSEDGYCFVFFGASPSIGLQRAIGGSVSTLLRSDYGYVDLDTWYSIRITRRYDGEFTLYLKGGSFSDWTLLDVTGGGGTNPKTDTNTRASKYIVLDFKAGDCITNIVFTN